MDKKEVKKTKSKKPLILKILGAVILLFFVYMGWIYYQLQTGQLFLVEGEVYTREEVEEKWPHKYHVEAKNTPEEVYSKFRQALLNNDIETALECIEEEERGKYRKDFSRPKVLKNYKSIPPVSEIKKDKEFDYSENYLNYYYIENKKSEDGKFYHIHFIKKQNGYWKIESI